MERLVLERIFGDAIQRSIYLGNELSSQAGALHLATRDARGPDWIRRVYLLEVQRGMMRVLLEKPVGTAGVAFDVWFKGPKGAAKSCGRVRDHRVSGSNSFVRPA